MNDPTPALPPVFPAARLIQENLQDLRRTWFWFLLLGVLLVVLGLGAIGYSITATLVTTVFVGYMLLIGGIFFLVGAFYTRCWGGFFLTLLAGLLHLVVGGILINHPAEAAIAYTLILAISFFVEGLFRILIALFGQFQNWLWVLLSGLITLALGILIWQKWPSDALWVIGTFVGINLVFTGWNYIWLALVARKLPV